MKKFLQIVALLVALLGPWLNVRATLPDIPDDLSTIYAGYFDVDDLRFWLYPSDDDHANVGAAREDIEHVTLPTEVTYKGKTYVVTSVAYAGFAHCSKLKSITFPDPEKGSIGLRPSSFWECKQLGPSVTVPGYVGYLEYNVFYGCPNLTELVFEKGDPINISGGSMYSYTCGYLEVESLVTGRDISFSFRKTPGGTVYSPYGLPNLKKLTVLDGTDVTKLMGYTKTTLRDLVIGNDVTGLPASMSDFTQLEAITVNSTEPPVCPEFTDGQYGTVLLTVPQNSLEAYRQADGWKNFLTIKESGIEAPSAGPSERTLTGRYDLQGRPATEGYRGLVIERYSDGSVEKKVMGR